MTGHKDSSGKASRRGLVAGLATLGALSTAQKASAAQDRRVVGTPVVVRMGERICINLANANDQPVAVRFHLLKASDFDVLASSAGMTLAPRTGTYWEVQMSADALGLPALEIIRPRDPASGLPSGIRAAVQHRNSAGETLSFVSGFYAEGGATMN